MPVYDAGIAPVANPQDLISGGTETKKVATKRKTVKAPTKRAGVKRKTAKAPANKTGAKRKTAKAQPIILDSVLDLRAAAPLADEFKARRGADINIDASNVERLGAQCAQVLLSAEKNLGD